MIQYEKERVVLRVHKAHHRGKALGQERKPVFVTTHLRVFFHRRLSDEMGNYTFRIFHVLIIACLGLSLFGCGYKGDPVYKDANTTTPAKKTHFL